MAEPPHGFNGHNFCETEKIPLSCEWCKWQNGLLRSFLSAATGFVNSAVSKKVPPITSNLIDKNLFVINDARCVRIFNINVNQTCSFLGKKFSLLPGARSNQMRCNQDMFCRENDLCTNYFTQESIQVSCVPSAAVAVGGRWCLPQCMLGYTPPPWTE